MKIELFDIVFEMIACGRTICTVQHASCDFVTTRRPLHRNPVGDQFVFSKSLCCFLLMFSLYTVPCYAQVDLTNSFIITLFPTDKPSTDTPTNVPTTTSPTLLASSSPSLSAAPSESPSVSFIPSISPQPSVTPTDSPTAKPTKNPTSSPTETPSVSSIPTHLPSFRPSPQPTISFAPSNLPSVSSRPTYSSSPSSIPSAPPSESVSPTDYPSVSPSQFPSSSPSTSSPTQSPTTNVTDNLFQTATLSMTIHGMNQDVMAISRKRWSLLTSRHVRNYWRGYGRDRSPFYVKEVSTLFLEERSLGSVEEDYPAPRRILFELKMIYMLRELDTAPGSLEELQKLVGRNADEEELRNFIYQWTGVFTLPFEQDSWRYLQSLDEELVNNTNFLWMEFDGVYNAGAQRRNAVLVGLGIASALLLVAVAVAVIFRSKIRDGALISPTGSDSPIVGAVIGVNASENILVSESYDDDYVHSGHFGAGHQIASLLRNNSRTDDEMDTSAINSFRDPGRNGSASGGFSDVESSGDVDRIKHMSQGTVFSGGTSVSARNSQGEVPSDEGESKEELPGDDTSNDAGSSACAPSFIGDFQMEIQDLED